MKKPEIWYSLYAHQIKCLRVDAYWAQILLRGLYLDWNRR